jgi:hypothetical protein
MGLKASALGASAILLACTALTFNVAEAASRTSAYDGAVTAQGVPNLEGTWTNATMTRWERPAEYGTRSVMTPAEVQAMEGQAAQSTARANKPTDPNATVATLQNDCSGGRSWCNYNAQWTEPGATVMRVGGQPRTSIVITPADGRIPYLPGKQQRAAPAGEGGARGPGDEGAFGNPEERSLAERCIVSQNFRNGALLTPTLYNNNVQIVQSKDTVAILVEMSHDVRLVRLNSKHLAKAEKPWFGDSIGWYDGDTLVVETTDFKPESLGPASDALKLTERFTRVGKNRVLYRFTVEDPKTYAQPWSGEYEFTSSPGMIYEYACHEGNRGLEGLLAGARFLEKQTVQQQAAAAPGR